MKRFFVTYFERGNRPKSSALAKFEVIQAIAKEDVLPALWQKLGLSQEEFKAKFKVLDIEEDRGQADNQSCIQSEPPKSN